MKNRIEKRLRAHLDVIALDLKDESHAHSNHNEAAAHGNTHFSLFIVASDFENMNLLARHRLINEILREEVKMIHALRMKVLNGKEHSDKNAKQNTFIS
jgi:BolA protein